MIMDAHQHFWDPAQVDGIAICPDGSCVAQSKLPCLALTGEPLARVLADRLEHPVALVRETEQALLDERLQRVEVGVRDILGGFEGAAAGEDGERSNEALLFLGKEVVAPGDRRPQRLLACIGVPASPEQIESLGETLEDLRRRKRFCAGSGELDRERQVVETSAELGDLPASGEASGGTSYSTSPWTRRSSRLVTSRVRLGQRSRRAESSGAASITCSRLSRRSSISRSPMCSASPSLAPRVCEIVSVTRAGSRREASPTQKTPAL